MLHRYLLICVFSTFSTQGLAENPPTELEEVVVSTHLRSLPTEDVDLFGFGKTLLETPRSASTVSAEQLSRFHVSDIDDLVAFAPGTFTQSFFGVAGSLDIRGTQGESYFRGMRRLDNPGNYPTPIYLADRIDIVRGPASPIFGPAKIGGYINIQPQTARLSDDAIQDAHSLELSLSTGSWDKHVITAEAIGPITDHTGYALHLLHENSGSYYDNTDTEQSVFSIAMDSDLNTNTQLSWGMVYHDFRGNQIAGWNRLSQALVDSGQYLSGSPAGLDQNQDGVISHQEYAATADFTSALDQLSATGEVIASGDGDGLFGINVFIPTGPTSVTTNDLDTLQQLLNPHYTVLSGNQVLVAPEDTLANTALTAYMDIDWQWSKTTSIKNQLFYDGYDNLNESAYGFSQQADSWTAENKTIVSSRYAQAWHETTLQFSPSLRYTAFDYGNDYTNEYFDRRDLQQASSSIDTRLLATQIGKDFSEYYVGHYLNLGAALLVDSFIHEKLNVTLGLRHDSIRFESSIPIEKLLLGNFTTGFVTASSDGEFLLNDFVDPSHYSDQNITTATQAKNTDTGTSWTINLQYHTDWGISPYITASEQATVIAGQGAEVTTANILAGRAMATSTLQEVGLKASLLDDRLYVAAARFEQQRTDFTAQAIVTNAADKSLGSELEMRWVPNQDWVVTASYTQLEVTNLETQNSGGRFSFFGAEDVPQLDPALIYGGVINGIVPNNGRRGATRSGIPKYIGSLTATYAWNDQIASNVSMVDVSSTYSGHSKVVKLPSYRLYNAGVAIAIGQWQVNVSGKNLTNEQYYRANFPNLFGSQIVLPELPRHYMATLSLAY